MKNIATWMVIGCLAAMLLSAPRAKASPINLVTNGGFEDGPTDVPNPTGWTYTQADFLADAEVSTGGAHSGEQEYGFFADSASGRGDIISQDIPTTPGVQYTLSFYAMNAYPNPNAVFRVWWGALTGYAILGSNGFDFGHTVYKQFTFTVTGGAGTSTLLGFEGQSANGTAFLIDDVSVTAVPEPTTGALLLLGAAGLMRQRRPSA